MDDADSIMIMTLRQTGCNIDSEITSCAMFTPELLMNSCALILNMIDDSLEIPPTVPADGTKRFKHCSKIAAGMKKIGYRDECRYDLFSYPNVTDTRKFLAFLIERLPRASGSEKETIVQEQTLLGQMKESLRQSFFLPWFLPLVQKPQPVDHLERHFTKPHEPLSESAEHDFWAERNEKSGGERDDQRRTVISVVTNAIAKAMFDKLDTLDGGRLHISPELMNKLGLKAKGRLDRNIEFRQEPTAPVEVSADKIEVDEREQREAEIASCTERLQKLTDAAVTAQKMLEAEIARIRELEDRLREATSGLEEAKEEVKKKTIIVAMLKDPEAAEAELNRLNKKAMDKIKHHATDLEKERQPLAQKYHKFLEKSRGDRSVSAQLTDDLRAVRKEMADLIEEAKKKQARLQQLKAEYEGMDKTAERTKYIAKITDMHLNLTAQKAHITKIITDTKTLMSESNSAEERLDRVFHEADEAIFNAANNPDIRYDKDGAAVDVYKKFIAVHQNYIKLTSSYNELGKLTNQMLDVRERIEDQARYDTSKKMEKLKADFESLVKENEKLDEKLEDE